MQELQLGGVNLKRRCIGKKLSALCLGAAAAVMLTAAVTPGTVWAEETAAVESTAENNSENTGEKPGQGQAAGLADEKQNVTAEGNVE